jgi:NAD(P)H-flavin reductase
VLPGNVTRIEVWPESNFNWTPAQHAFLRFTDFAPLDNHPFTIASPSPAAQGKQRHLVFLARSHTGFTHKLASYVRNNSKKQEESVTTTVWVDGPYGGVTRPIHTRYDSLILVAGGTGISACLPWVLDSAAKAKSVNARLKRVILVWAVKRIDAISWMANELKNIVDSKEKDIEFALRIHITGSAATSTANDIAVKGKDGSRVSESAADDKIERKGSEASDIAYEDQIAALGSQASGRPVMPQVLTEYVRPGERSMIFGCGPEGFRADLANAVAAAQKRVLSEECVEIGMHLETFGW